MTDFVEPLDVQYFDLIKGELVHTQEHKANKFIEHGCIVWDEKLHCFLCRPIEGYNTRTYMLVSNGAGRFSCNCQGYRKKEKMGQHPFCSHVYALMLFLSGGRGEKKGKVTLDDFVEE